MYTARPDYLKWLNDDGGGSWAHNMFTFIGPINNKLPHFLPFLRHKG